MNNGRRERAVEEVLRNSHPNLCSDGLGEFMDTMQTTFTFLPGGLRFVTVQAVFLQETLQSLML